MSEAFSRAMGARRELRIAIVFVVAFAVLPVLMVAARGGANLHSRIQRLWALQISIQSDDPGRLAIADPEADLEILEELLVPSPARRARTRRMYESWQRRRGWRIYEIDPRSVEVAESGDSAVARYLMKQSRKRERVRWGGTDEWIRRDGVWYMSRRRRTLLDTRSSPAPSPLLPRAAPIGDQTTK